MSMIGMQPEDRFMVAIGRTLIVITQEGKVFGADIVHNELQPVFQFEGPKIGFNPEDRFAVTLGNMILIITQNGSVFGSEVVGRKLGPVFRYDGATIGFNPQDKFMVSVGVNMLAAVTSGGSVFGAQVSGRMIRPVSQIASGKIGLNPQDKFMVSGNFNNQDLNIIDRDKTLVVVNDSGNVFGANIVPQQIGIIDPLHPGGEKLLGWSLEDPVKQFEGDKISFDRPNRFIVALDQTLATITTDGNVFLSDVQKGKVGPALRISRDDDEIAARAMTAFHRSTGGVFGPLGVPLGPPRRAGGSSYVQSFQIGSLHLNDAAAQVTGEVEYEADITLAAVLVFGTQDSTEDESYVVMSLVTVDPNSPIPVQTQRTAILNGVKQGDTIFKNSLRMRQRFSGTSGVMVHLAVWDHESGNQDKIRDDINKVLQDGASKAASALAGGDLAGQGGTVGDIMNFDVGGVKPFQLLTLGASDLLASAFADDLIGEHVYVIPPGNIRDWAEQDAFTASIRPNGDKLDFDVQFNWPPRGEDEFLFTDGHGSYKVYLLIRGVKTITPVTPNLPI
jgi:hypothetical protein